MVLGSHPHTVQPVEFYGNSFIAYSMGNFVFDQMQRPQTREGFFLKFKFEGIELVRIEMVPYIINDHSRPVVFEEGGGQHILDKVLEISGIGK